jgi:hypothetical protein
MWAGTDNRFGPEDFKANEGLAVVCWGKENEWLTPPIQIVDFDTPDNDLDNRKEYIYTYDGSNWIKWDFYACPVWKVYDTVSDTCKEADDGNLVKVYDLADAYKAGDESETVDALLDIGEVSVHSSLTYHSSNANRNQEPRVGMVVHFCTDEAKRIMVTGENSDYLDQIKNPTIAPVIYQG